MMIRDKIVFKYQLKILVKELIKNLYKKDLILIKLDHYI